MNEKKQVSLRVSEDLIDRVKKIAFLHKRSVNKEIEYIIEEYVTLWEKENSIDSASSEE